MNEMWSKESGEWGELIGGQCSGNLRGLKIGECVM